jgi:hypothetical protein
VQEEINVFPNPANESLVISHQSLGENTDVKIFDSAGRIGFEKYVSDDIRINTSSWKQGLYFIQLGMKKLQQISVIP